MKPSPANKEKRSRLIRPMALLAAVVSVGALYLGLFPSQQRMKALAEQGKSDALSIPYLQLLLRTHPGDSSLRMALAHKLAALGKWNDARNILDPILKQSGKEGVQARLAMLEIDFSLANTLPKDSWERNQVLALAARQIESLGKGALETVALVRIAEISLAVNRPDMAATLYMKLASIDSVKRQTWLDLAAKAYLASGAPTRAGYAYQAVAASSPNDVAIQRKYTLLALDAFLAGNAGKEALHLAEASVPRLGSDREFMQRVVAIALLQNDIARAQQLGRQLVSLAPDEPLILKQQVDVELAAKDLAAALSLARRLVALDPSDIEQRIRLARIAEWSIQQEIALEQWAWLARRDSAGEAMDNALRLASGRNEDALWLELAALRAQLRPLKPQELAALAAVQIRNKEVKQLLGFLQGYVERYPAQREVWETLAKTQEQQGDLTAAVATWQRMGPHLIRPVEAAGHQAELLLKDGKVNDALTVLRAVRTQATVGDSYYWQTYGDLAWDSEQKTEALAAYRTLWEANAGDVRVAERLIQLYLSTGEARLAIATARQAYLRFSGEPRWLLLAMDAASQAALWEDLQELGTAAKSEEKKFANSEMYWLLQAHVANHFERRQEARSAYKRALALNPASVSVRVNLLWFEINGDDKQQLGERLRQWRGDALAEPAYWGAYAAGLLLLRRTDESLPWFERQARVKPDDYLWLLSYADALTQTGRADQAWRLRRHVFLRLRPRLSDQEQALKPSDKSLQLAYASLVRDFDGAPAGDRVLQKLLARGFNDADVHELLVASYLTQEKYESARYWLLNAHAERHKLPDWQSLAVALAQNDRAAIEQILKQKDSMISTPDRVTALRRLGRNEQALVLAEAALLEPDGHDNEVLQQHRDQLALQLSRRFEFKLEERRFGNLKIDGSRLAGSFPLSGGRATVQLAHNRLSSSSNELSVTGFQNENDISVMADLLVKDDPMRFSLGVNQRSDKTLPYGRYEWTHRLAKTVSTRLEASVNGLTDETTALRAIGAKDKLAVGVSVNLTDSEYARVELAGQHFHTRSGATLGSGYRVEGELGSTIFKKIPIWQVRLSGSLEKNRLTDRLPAELLGSALAPSASVDSVLSRRFSTLGVGTTIGFGHKDGLERSPYGLIDAWVGRQWPGNDFAYNLRISMGRPIFGPDQLSVEGFYTNVQAEQSGSANRGIGVMYRYQF